MSFKVKLIPWLLKGMKIATHTRSEIIEKKASSSLFCIFCDGLVLHLINISLKMSASAGSAFCVKTSCCKDRSGLCHCVSLCAGKIGSISHFHCPLAFYHVLCGHKGRENPDIVNSQSLRGRKRPRLSWDRHKIYGSRKVLNSPWRAVRQHEKAEKPP